MEEVLDLISQYPDKEVAVEEAEASVETEEEAVASEVAEEVDSEVAEAVASVEEEVEEEDHPEEEEEESNSRELDKCCEWISPDHNVSMIIQGEYFIITLFYSCGPYNSKQLFGVP